MTQDETDRAELLLENLKKELRDKQALDNSRKEARPERHTFDNEKTMDLPLDY